MLRAKFGRVDPARLLATGRFDFARAAEAPGWLAELRGEHVPEAEEHGIASFVSRADRPFHPGRSHHLLAAEWPGVIRGQGPVLDRLAARPGGELLAGRRRRADRAGRALAGGHAQGQGPVDPGGGTMLARDDYAAPISVRQLIEFLSWIERQDVPVGVALFGRQGQMTIQDASRVDVDRPRPGTPEADEPPVVLIVVGPPPDPVGVEAANNGVAFTKT